MSTKVDSIKLPKTIGGNNLVENLGKINLSAELKEFLAALDARLVVTYSSGSDKPDVSVRDNTGKLVCAIDEFLKLGGFRRWVNDELKALDKEEASREKLKLIAMFLRRAKELSISLGIRMDEGNETRFKQFNAMSEIVRDNLEKISATADGVYRTFLMTKGRILVRIYYELMLSCLGQTSLAKEALETALWENGIPKWIHSKFVDKQFTTNVRHDATVLLFPRGNYTKGIGLTKRELSSEKFLASNAEILGRAGSIIQLARHNWSGLLPVPPAELEKDVESFLNNHMWILIHPYSWTEILEIRASGKSPPIFKARQKPNPKQGTKTRPETETQRICRESYNTLMEINVNWLHLANFIIPCADPLETFWQHLTGDAAAWEITPAHNLYHNLQDFETDLGPIHNLNNKELLKLMANIVIIGSRVPTGSKVGLEMAQVFADMENKPAFVEGTEVPIGGFDARLRVDLTAMKAVELEDNAFEEAKKFLGVGAPKKKTGRNRGGASSIRLHTSVLNELEILRGHTLYDPVKNWIASSFKTGNKVAVQMIAAERVAGEILKNQDRILTDDFDEYDYLGQAEEYDEE
jgi:hypothetical protein